MEFAPSKVGLSGVLGDGYVSSEYISKLVYDFKKYINLFLSLPDDIRDFKKKTELLINISKRGIEKLEVHELELLLFFYENDNSFHDDLKIYCKKISDLTLLDEIGFNEYILEKITSIKEKINIAKELVKIGISGKDYIELIEMINDKSISDSDIYSNFQEVFYNNAK